MSSSTPPAKDLVAIEHNRELSPGGGHGSPRPEFFARRAVRESGCLS